MTERSVRVLVVDDDASVCEALKAVLVSEGHTVVTTQNASEALLQARTFDAQVAIVDLNMPGGVPALRTVLPGLRVILHTGSDPERVAGASEAVDLVIQKGSVLSFLAKFRAFLAI